ncbi:MAG: tetratricopeptide repeat protein [Bacteroidetes bacterium]|nr:tetratricopeptide repeat protein [Bacteroidota bacterium]
MFHVKSHFLGDGLLNLRSFQSIESADQLIYTFKREPLVAFIILLITNFFISLRNTNPVENAYIWLSIASGIAFITIAWKFVQYYVEEKNEQLMLFFLLITTGITQLFFGYIENYTPSAAAVLLFLTLGIAYLRGNISIVWVIIIYGISILLHFGAIIFLPILASLFYIAVKRNQTREFAASLFLTGVIVYILLQLSQYPVKLFTDILNEPNRHLVPFSLPLNNLQAYVFFSLNHAIDIVNILILTHPVFLFMIFISGVVILKNHKTSTIDTLFLLFAAICSIIFILIFNCEIGMSRDWDIFAPISLGIPAAAIALWHSANIEKKIRQRILIMFCAVSLCHTSLWIGINSDEVKAQKRFIALNDDRLWSKHASLSAYEELAIYHRDHNNNDMAIQYYQKYVGLDSTNERVIRNLAEIYQSAGNKKKAIEIYESIINKSNYDYRILVNLGILLAEEQRYSEAMTLFRRAEEQAPEEANIKYCLGQTIAISEKAYQKALPLFLDAICLDQNFVNAYYGAAECYFQTGDSLRAEEMLDKLREITNN